MLLDADPTTALAAFNRAIDLADAAGSHYVGGVARVSAITLESRTAPARAALPLYVDVIERWLDAGSWSHLLTTMRNLVLTLTEAGAYAVAAQVLGAVTRTDQHQRTAENSSGSRRPSPCCAPAWVLPTSSSNALSVAPLAQPCRAARRSRSSGTCLTHCNR